MPRLAFDLPEQASAFSLPFVLQVIEDKRLKLTSALRPLLTQGADFRFRFEQILRAAERHVFVDGQPDNPIDLVEDWITSLKWEIDAFWVLDAFNNSYYPKDNRHGVALTAEHWKRSGEYIAEGIAIAFLEARLGVSRARFAFYSPRDKKPRPDFIVTPKPSDRLLILYPGQASLGVEIRARSRWNCIHKTDHRELNDKKARLGRANQLSVYCSYGERNGRFNGPLIILGDPPGEGVIISQEIVTRTVVQSYLQTCQRIGLWSYAHVLESRLRGYDEPLPTAVDTGTGRLSIVKRVTANKSIYIGREFATFYDYLNDPEMTESQLRARAEIGDLGSIIYYGVSATALDMIASHRWDELVYYFDDNSLVPGEATVTGDGVYREVAPVVPGSPEAETIMNFTVNELRRRSGMDGGLPPRQ